MGRALELAARALGRTSPNPMVGALVVKGDRVVGQGYHARAGTPHAEVHALGEAGGEAKGATLYVTLEPCCHHGKTGPCSEAVVAAGVGRVVAAMADPNPLVAGKGFERLRQAGIVVECGVLEEEARQLNEVFIKYITTGRPFVVLKAAMSLDGKIATANGLSQWITGPRARQEGHRLRNSYDAILVGINTVLTDNPSLTCRLPEGGGRDPVRIILDSMARTPLGARVITQGSSAPTIVAVSEQAPGDRVRALLAEGVRVVPVPGSGGRVNIEALLSILSKEITSVLVEGGARVHASALEAGIADKVLWFVAPKIMGGIKAPGPVAGSGVNTPDDAVQLDRVRVSSVDQDICIEGYVVKRGG